MAVMPDSCLASDGGDDRGCWPPGFRFHPTDEELVLYYLKRKICRRRLKLDIIRELDVYKCDPEELPGQSLLKTGDRQWFFFSPRDRKYPNGARSNRATRQGYWKATGKDRSVTCNSRDVGVKKTLVFYRGRAPSGARTDWVMHEYTMDEDELKRCNNVKDYYALYKVYKKSGPGPKNGEQYGAPFKEEDWPDDEHAAPVEKQSTAPPPPLDTRAVARVEQPLNDLDNFLKQLTCENPNGGYTNGPPQVAVDEVTQSTLLDPSCREVMFPPGALDVSSASSQQFGMQVSLDFNQSGTSSFQSPGAPEVKSIPDNSDPVYQICEEDFLEMDDLLGPEPTFSTTDTLAEHTGFDNVDGLSELDLYHDAALFFHEMGPVGQESTSHVYETGFQLQHNAVTNHVNYQLQPHSGVEDVNYQLQPHSGVEDVNYQLQPHSGVEDVNYQLQPHSGVDDVNYLQPEEYCSDQLWVHDQRSNSVLTPTESTDGSFSHATSGVVNESCSNNPTKANEKQTGEEDQDSAGWLSSALWSFVESIPTTPASAAESPLVNKAFERMSSFSRLRMNVKSFNNNDVDDVSNARNRPANARSAGRNRGFLLLSVLGALCAVVWVLVGSVRVLQRTIS